jgi:NAD(P) transhydrogenase
LDEFDLIVIGAGPAGVTGAMAAALMGARTVLVERDAELGGAGINTGTIPSKTLRETALALSGLRARRLHGVDLSLRREASVADFTRHRDNVVRGERERVAARLGQFGVARRTGEARFVDAHTVEVVAADGVSRLRGAHVLVATGSSPFRPPEFAFGHPRVHDSDEILRIECLPRVLAVIGAGVIGSEYASTFAALGTQVHLIDGRPGLLPFLDNEIARALAGAMAGSGIVMRLGESVESCVPGPDGAIAVRLDSGEELACDDVLVCSGRTSNTGALGLERAGVATGKRGLIVVDANFRSSVPHILAAGDVIGAPALAATGMEQARVAVTRALGSDAKRDLAALLPSGIYTIPEVGTVGATEESLRADGVDYVVGRWRAADTPRGSILGDAHGMIKLLFRRGDMRLLGVHVLGEQATETVHVGMVAMLCEGDADLFNRACFNYPTLGDLYKNATYDALLRARDGGAGLGPVPG